MEREKLSYRKRFRSIYKRKDALLLNLRGIIPESWEVVYIRNVKFENDQITLTLVKVEEPLSQG